MRNRILVVSQLAMLEALKDGRIDSSHLGTGLFCLGSTRERAYHLPDLILQSMFLSDHELRGECTRCMIVALENAEESSRVSFRQEGSTNNFVELNVLLGRNGYLPVDSGKAHYGYSEAKRLVEEANPDILVIA